MRAVCACKFVGVFSTLSSLISEYPSFDSYPYSAAEARRGQPYIWPEMDQDQGLSAELVAAHARFLSPTPQFFPAGFDVNVIRQAWPSSGVSSATFLLGTTKEVQSSCRSGPIWEGQEKRGTQKSPMSLCRSI